MTPEHSVPPENEWDEILARELVGAIVLGGITYTDAGGEPLSNVQFYGLIAFADRTRGIAIECHGELWKGELAHLPPSTTFFERAQPGKYHLRSTDEVVVDPAYIFSARVVRAHQS